MVKFGLTWLGGILALYGFAEIIYESVLLFSFYGELPIEQRSEFMGWLQSAEASAYTADLKSDYARGIFNLSFGLIMLGLKRLIDAAEDRNNVNVTQMSAKKDLGNWPPSV